MDGTHPPFEPDCALSFTRPAAPTCRMMVVLTAIFAAEAVSAGSLRGSEFTTRVE